MSGASRPNASSTGSRPHAGRREAARTGMVNAAIELLAENGYVGMTLADVSKRAGYSHGLAHFYFGSKAEIAKAVAAETDLRYFKHLVAGSGRATTGLGYVEGWVNANFEYVQLHPENLRASLVIFVESVTTVPEVQQIYLGLADRNVSLLEAAFERGKADGTVQAALDPYAAAVTVSGALLGFNYQWLANPRIGLRRRQTALLGLLRTMSAAPPAARRRRSAPSDGASSKARTPSPSSNR
jgi:AcrR family transcriptional regulator